MRPIVALLLWMLAAWPVLRADEPIVVRLWPGRPPDEIGERGPEKTRLSPRLDHKQVEVLEPTRLITDVTQPSLTVFRAPVVKAVGTGVLVCPGGGYWDLYWELEGEEVAAWLNSIGVTAFVLKYRVPRRPDEPKGEPARRPLQDAQRALRLVRDQARRWDIKTNCVGLVGFSAGGHLAIATATTFEKPSYAPVDDADKTSCRPDFAIAAYPGYLKAKEQESLAPGLDVPAGTPPVFLVHGTDDIISPPENSVLMYLALKRAGVPAELHVFADTVHDFGVRVTARPYSRWTELCTEWLKDQGFLGGPRTR